MADVKSLAEIGIHTEERDIKCEPVCHKIIGLMDSAFFEKDKAWLDEYIAETNKMFIRNLIKHYFEALFSKVDFAMETSYKKAEEKLFGVPKQNVSLKFLDEVLKK